VPALCRRLSSRRTVGSPRLSEERFGGSIDERHLTRRLRGTLRVVHESIGVMLASEPSTRGADLVGACPKPHAKYLVR
jgi:hypothetical protein